MNRSFVKNKLELGYKDELHNYDIFPKVVASGKATAITIKPLGWHAAFQAGESYNLAVCPLDEGVAWDYPNRSNDHILEVVPDADGCIRFSFDFFGEQEFFIRLNDGKSFNLELSVFAVGADLVGRYPFRGDLHMHTRRSDGSQAPEIVAANYRKTGYDFTVISDHMRYYPSLDAIAAYADARVEFVIIPGEEVHLPKDFPNHVNDVHILNFGGAYSINALVEGSENQKDAGGDAPERRAILPNPPPVRSKEEFWAEIDAYAEGLAIPEGIERFTYACCHWIFNEIKKGGGLGIFCHPYWISNVYQVPPAFVDYMMETHPFGAFEVLGGENYYEQNGLQTIQYYEDRAKGRKYPIVGSTDSHRSVNNRNSHICSTFVFAPENTREALIQSIQDFYSVAVDTISAEPRFVGEMRLARYACFLEKEFFPLHDELCFEEGRAMKDYVCGVPGAKEELAFLHGRMKAQREKYFAF
ncbi:MAG: hypothetical protein LBS96_00575 [Oscillospiraceae bacterium]|jgi:hypothetical protein|nr:hypothetical protein [Oscillospiraceae bacterium]